jgi:anti-sigma factor RsiW
MICPSRRGDTTLLLDYAMGRLAPAEYAAVAGHANGCDDCAAALVEYSSVSDALDAWEAPPLSAHFNPRLWERIERAASAPWYGRSAESVRFQWLKPAVSLAAAALVIAAGFLLDHRSSVSGAAATSRVSATEADQAERTLDDLQLLRQFDVAVAAPGSARSM